MTVFRHFALLLGLPKGWGSAQSEAEITRGYWDGGISQGPLELPVTADIG